MELAYWRPLRDKDAAILENAATSKGYSPPQPCVNEPDNRPRRAQRVSFRGESRARRLPACGTSHTIASAYGILCAAREHLRASAQSIYRSEVARLRLPSRGYRDNSS